MVLREGDDCAIIAAGDCWGLSEKAAALLERQGLHPALIDARFVKPLDAGFYAELFAAHSHIITLENNALPGGFGSGVLEAAAASAHSPAILTLGYPDRFIEHGSIPYLLERMELTPEHIAARITRFLQPRPSSLHS
jgi:1-deoxy-D-xylulose-5-phosphate synthase